MARVDGSPRGDAGADRASAGDGARASAAGRANGGDRAVRVTFPGLAEATGSTMVVEVAPTGETAVDGEPAGVRREALDGTRARLIGADATHAAQVTPMPDASRSATGVARVEVVVDGWRFEVDVEPEARARLRERATSARGAAKGAGPLELRAIIPGRVVSVDVAIGDAVDLGGRLLVIEAMKMQNELRSPRTGTVARLAVGAGQTVERGDLLLVLE